MLQVEQPEYTETAHAPAHTAAGGKAGLNLAEKKATKKPSTKV
jgi:hypothetical protein